MYSPLINDKKNILKLIIDKLGTAPNDFSEQLNIIKERKKRNERWLAAGVLLLLLYKSKGTTSTGEEPAGEFVFQLIKRSSLVPQGGDLSCPGGILDPTFDRMLRRIIQYGLPPVLKGNAREYAETRGNESFLCTSLFLANAMRESWEEIRLNPFNATFLGPLPCYNLTLFTKTIFPVVGLVNRDKPYHLNGEVDKIIEIPIASFFEEDNYAMYSLEASGSLKHARDRQWDFPCLVHTDSEGKEEILWGATFNIIMSFLKIVFDFDISRIIPTRIITRTLDDAYLTGNAHA